MTDLPPIPWERITEWCGSSSQDGRTEMKVISCYILTCARRFNLEGSAHQEEKKRLYRTHIEDNLEA